MLGVDWLLVGCVWGGVVIWWKGWEGCYFCFGELWCMKFYWKDC